MHVGKLLLRDTNHPLVNWKAFEKEESGGVGGGGTCAACFDGLNDDAFDS